MRLHTTRTFITVANLLHSPKENITCEIATKIARVNGILDLSSVKGECHTKCLRCEARFAQGDWLLFARIYENVRCKILRSVNVGSRVCAVNHYVIAEKCPECLAIRCVQTSATSASVDGRS